jgi:nicotinate-nucleotide adenylyltransferase
MKLGVLGGTFDPIHLGHVAAAEAAIQCAGLDRVLLVPTNQPPHRTAAKAPAEYRLDMCRLAAADDPRLECSDIELKRPGPSFTLDTLEALHAGRPDDELHLILGWDAARLFRTWHKPQQVRALASVVVVGRPGTDSPNEVDLKAAGLGGAGVTLCLEHTPAVSASEIRRDVMAARPIGGKVAPKVEQYIRAHHLYAQ